ncbi:hypothetical protein [Nostoc sp.]|uniref:hypothetical protein n=1 Tax=Nostoc sp. TaxID=1180 RepID=UPI002FF462C5
MKRVGLSLKYDSGVHSQIPKLRFSGSSFLVARVVKHTLEDFSNILLYSGKYCPEIYLDENIRSGISTFSLLASADEIAAGCQKLAADINIGYITEIVKKL